MSLHFTQINNVAYFIISYGAVVFFECRFGHLACFTSDVENFLLVLSLDKKTELLKRLKKSSNSLSTVPIKALGQSITLLKIQELVGNLYSLPVDGVSRYSRRAYTHTQMYTIVHVSAYMIFCLGNNSQILELVVESCG